MDLEQVRECQVMVRPGMYESGNYLLDESAFQERERYHRMSE